MTDWAHFYRSMGTKDPAWIEKKRPD